VSQLQPRASPWATRWFVLCTRLSFLLEIRCRSVIFFISTPTNLKVFGMASESEKEFEAQGRTDVIAELKDKLANQEVCSS
jgi:hypothetical protein